MNGRHNVNYNLVYRMRYERKHNCDGMKICIWKRDEIYADINEARYL